MRLVLFTIEDLDLVPALLEPTLQAYGNRIAKIYVSDSWPPDWAFVRKRFRFLLGNRYPFCIRAGDWWRYLRRSLRRERTTGAKDMVQYLRIRGFDAERIREIRTRASRERVAKHEPDVILFAPFNKIAGPKFLAVPSIGTFNLHLGKLPGYRGGFSAFWVLRFGDPEAGASIHRAVEELDRGEIVEEVRLPVRTRSMRDLMQDTVDATGPAVVRALAKIEAGGWEPVDTSGREEGYYAYPTRDDFREFYLRGCRLI